MADFCWDCLADELYPEHPERNDLRGLCEPGDVVSVLCEGCGAIFVDHEGRPSVPCVDCRRPVPARFGPYCGDCLGRHFKPAPF